MKLWNATRCGWWLLACGWLCGCLPLPDPDAEEKNPLIVDARAKKTAYNFQGAVASLEKALEGNPRLALAHWELGLIFCQEIPDPAAAIYHFRRLLKLRPDWRHAETARRKIVGCQIELAKNVPLGPQVPAIQQQIDALIGKVHDMEKEGNRLRTTNQTLQLQVQQLLAENALLKDQWRTYTAAASNRPAAQWPLATARSNTLAPAPPAPGTTPPSPPNTPTPDPRTFSRGPVAVPPTARAGTGSAAMRQHTVRARETLSSIARRYGVTVRSLVQANPNVHPDRLKVGQVLRIPES